MATNTRNGRSFSGQNVAQSSVNGGNKRSIKVVVVGDGSVGKTCLLIAYTTKQFPYGDYVPTVFENYFGAQECQGNVYNLTLWDTAGQEDYERLRPLSYPGADVFLLCFSVDSIHSFQNISSKWHPEIKQHCPKIPYVLVGTKTDLRPNGLSKKSSFRQLRNSSSNEEASLFVTKEMGKKLAAKIKAFKYVESSAKSMDGVEEVFIEAVKASHNLKSRQRKHECVVL